MPHPVLSPADLIRCLSQPLEPIPTGRRPRLPRLEGLRGIVFDIYGTLVVSASGDIGVTDADHREVALRSILRDLGLEPPADTPSLTGRMIDLIAADHARSRCKGTAHPEIEIREIWAQLLDTTDRSLIASVATAYECATNPIWPMPGADDLLGDLQAQGFLLGIVSNAQFYTPLLFEAFFLQSLDQLGFDPDLCFFSYKYRQAKPGIWLYEQLRDALAAREIDAAEVLYVGNDALKDIHPAARAGFRTALFAGDQRSLRLREDVADLLSPDVVLTELSQIRDVIGLGAVHEMKTGVPH